MWSRFVQSLKNAFGLSSPQPQAVSVPISKASSKKKSAKKSHAAVTEMGVETVELADGFEASTGVLLRNGHHLKRIGRCNVNGDLVVMRCPQLSEVSAGLVVKGLTLRGASKLQGLPDGLKINGDLRLINCAQLRSLPKNLEIDGSLIIRGCPRLEELPACIRVRKHLYLIGKTRLRSLPARLTIGGDIVAQQSLTGIEPGFAAAANLVLVGCVDLKELPANLNVAGELIIRRCPKLDRLPGGLEVKGGLEARHATFQTLPHDLKVGTYLDLEGCTELVSLPDNLRAPHSLRLRRCIRLTGLPSGLDVGSGLRVRNWNRWHYSAVGPSRSTSQLLVNGLDLENCSRVTALPGDLKVRGPIEISGSGIRALPVELESATLFWRGVAVPAQVAFSPESFSGEEILKYPNAEVRRILMEILGPTRILSLLQPRVIDEDSDAGGERRLLAVDVPNAREPFVFLECRCPSTKRQYALRTPPTMKSCHQAAAWIAGFDNPDDYKPLVET